MATRNDDYSTKIRLCTGTKDGGPGTEPCACVWGDDSSMSDGHATIHKVFYFTLVDGFHFHPESTRTNHPREVCPAEIFHAKGFPAKGERLTDLDGSENPWYKRYHYTGNGTLEHMLDSEIWVYTAEYTTKGSDFQDDDRTPDDDNTDPWNRKPWNVSLDFPEQTVPFRYAYVNNKRFGENMQGAGPRGTEKVKRRKPLLPVLNSAGDRIMAQTTRYDLQLSFTYALKPRSDLDMSTILKAQGSLNKKDINLLGLKIPAGCGRIISLKPQLIDESTDASGNKVRSYWEMQAVVQLAADEDSFNQKLYDMGSRALFNDGSTVSDTGVVQNNAPSAKMHRDSIYCWWSFSSANGQNDVNSTMQYGSRKLMLMAKDKYDKKCKDKFGAFAFEPMEDAPLNEYGMVDAEAMNANNADRFGDYHTLEFPEFKEVDWNQNSIFKQVSGKGGKIKW